MFRQLMRRATLFLSVANLQTPALTPHRLLLFQPAMIYPILISRIPMELSIPFFSDGSGGWYVGGSFNTIGGLTRQRLAHVNSDMTIDANQT
jgi:hypothetical protein